ncbi:thiamine pyrophosphate-dependent enzyme [Streptomyces sp. NPDC101249]|uniref:thiamine pyrophosphate-dependent enzyme n=1 Tax=Streptomyces sp. NPDC101249 TaxID=3366140 RepID=UPI003801FE63
MNAPAPPGDAPALDPDVVLDTLVAHGYRELAVVPCSYLTPLLERAARRPDIVYFPATCEGEAISVAAGAWLAGRRVAVALQNSGLGDALNPLASLCLPYGIPVLFLVSVRGEPGTRDEPHHDVMGRTTARILDDVGIRHAWLPGDPDGFLRAIEEAECVMAATRRPYCLLTRKGSFRDLTRPVPPAPAAPRRPPSAAPALSRAEAIRRLRERLPADQVVITTTGLTSRELYAAGDRPTHLYLSGSMGCAGAVGLGLARAGRRPVAVLDGDGAVLMRFGTLVSAAASAVPGFLHVVFNNGCYDSTGGQPVQGAVPFAATAALLGYAATARCDSLAELQAAYDTLMSQPGPRLLEIKVTTDPVPAPRVPLALPEIATRLRALLDPPAAAAPAS